MNRNHPQFSLRQRLRRVFFKSPYGILLFYKIRILREKFALARDSDLEYIRKEYFLRYGKVIDLELPQRWSEKMQWMKLFYRDENIPICTDKFTVRDYIVQKGYKDILTRQIGCYQRADDIVFDDLPEKFVVKATHGSGWNWICLNKADCDWSIYRRIINSWLKLNLYVFGREWNYKNLQPRILIEEYLDLPMLVDYKFWCCNGRVEYIQINFDIDGGHFVDFYTPDWEKLPFTYVDEIGSDLVLSEPRLLPKMLAIAEDLGSAFPFVRIDLYDLGDAIKFGELTFFPGGGMTPFTSCEEDYDAKLGEKLQLPELNYNYNLYDQL